MRMRGFTLVELLLSSLLGALLVAGAMSAFAQGRVLYERSERLARLHERASYVLSVLESDVQLAGNYGFHSAAAGLRLPASLPASVRACEADFAASLLVPLGGVDQRYGMRCGASGGGAMPSSDSLTLRRAAVETVAPEAGRLQIVSARLSPQAQQLVMDGSIPQTLRPGAVELHNLIVRSYYVARRADGERAGKADPLPALRVKSLSALSGQPAFIDTEVMSGIEDLQLELGYVLPAVDGVVTYVASGAVPIGAHIAAARVWLRLRSEDAEIGYRDVTRYRYANQSFDAADHYQRLLVSRTIQLRNAGT